MAVKLGEWLSCLEYGPCYHSTCLLAVGGKNKLYILQCHLNELQLNAVQTLSEALETDILVTANCTVGGQIQCIAWSMDSTLSDSECYARIAIAGSDCTVYLFSYDGIDSTISSIGSHDKCINSVACQEELVASVGDDLLCKLWNIANEELMMTFQLSSPGVTVSFHPHDSQQLLVSEQQGRLRLYNVTGTKGAAILSLECPGGTLLQSDWSSSNSQLLRVGSVGGTFVYLWNMTRSSLPYNTINIANGGALTRFKWSPISDNVFAITSANGLFQIHNLQHQKTMVSCTLPAAKDISWHRQLPIVSTITNNEINHWSVQI